MKKLLNNLSPLISATLRHELINGSFYIFVGLLFGSFFAFLLNLFLARNLSYSNYGEYSSLLSIFSLATIPAGSLGIVIVRYATSYFADKDMDRLSAFYKRMLVFWLLISIAIFIIYSFLSPLISSFLKINDPSSIIIIGLAIAFSYFGIANSSFLQAITNFKFLSFTGIAGASVRLISGFIFVTNGLKVLGASLALLISPVVAAVLGFIPLRKLINHRSTSNVTLHTKDMIKYGLPASFSILFLSSFVSSDVLLVKHFLTPTQAGFYGGVSLIGKVIFYFTGPIPVVMFPLLVKRQTEGSSIKNLLHIAVGLVLFASVSITAFYFIFPDFTIKLFLGGGRYLSMVPYLGLFGIFIMLFSINNIFVNFFLSLKKTRVVYLIIVGALLQLFLIVNFHNDFSQIIYSSIISSLFLLAILLLYYIKVYGIHNSSK